MENLNLNNCYKFSTNVKDYIEMDVGGIVRDARAGEAGVRGGSPISSLLSERKLKCGNPPSLDRVNISNANR